MAATPVIKSDNAFKTNILLGIIGAGLLILGVYLIWVAWADVYPQIAGIVLGAFFSFLGLYGLITLYRFDRILIDSDQVLIRSIFGNTRKVIFLKDITSFPG